MSEEKIAVRCETEAERYEVVRTLGLGSDVGKFFTSNGNPQDWYFITIDRKSSSREWWCNENGYTIIPASEYLREEKEFKVGDRVSYDGILKNITNPLGTIRLIEPDCIGVEFDLRCGIHALNGYGVECKEEHGQWFKPRKLRSLTNQPKTTKKEESEMASIGKNFIKVFSSDTELAVRMSDRFGNQYGDNARDLIALENDSKKLQIILKAEDEAEAKAVKNK